MPFGISHLFRPTSPPPRLRSSASSCLRDSVYRSYRLLVDFIWLETKLVTDELKQNEAPSEVLTVLSYYFQLKNHTRGFVGLW